MHALLGHKFDLLLDSTELLANTVAVGIILFKIELDCTIKLLIFAVVNGLLHQTVLFILKFSLLVAFVSHSVAQKRCSVSQLSLAVLHSLLLELFVRLQGFEFLQELGLAFLVEI